MSHSIRAVFLVSAALVLATWGTAYGQATTYCVIPPDSAWRPAGFGYEHENHEKFSDGVLTVRAYPIIRNVRRGSAADSAGIRDGDQLRAIDGYDLVKRSDSARVRGPGIRHRLTIGRGESTFVRTLSSVAARGPCSELLEREAARRDANERLDTIAVAVLLATDYLAPSSEHGGGVHKRSDAIRAVREHLLAADPHPIDSIRSDSTRIRLYGDVAIVTGFETLAMTFTKHEPPRRVVVRDAYTDVRVLRGGEWLLVNAQHTPLP
jgi:hypothetical protein